ncbi:MAG TPA: RNA methyltransferase [Bacillota bacterium]|nr:RNA methyltransferase [Fastidiosipila sp.]HPX93512.1 RNA methyltransferase [Bacillota bacterium]HQB81736.1 RNA methyltransferase [Bacillota bacterium]
MRKIQSRHNPLFKKLAALKSVSYARKNQLIRLEGLRQVLDALESGFIPDHIFFSDDRKGRGLFHLIGSRLGEKGIQIEDDRMILLSASLFSHASGQKSPQGVMAFLTYRPGRLSACLESLPKEASPKRLLVLEAIQDPGNLGTLIRTADAFDFDGIILTDSSASVWNSKTVAASMGSLFHLPLFEEEHDIRTTLRLLKQADFEIIASVLEGEDLREARPFHTRMALLLGNEGSGLSAGAVEESDRLIKIPMAGRAESLNVASAGAIMLWEIAGRYGAVKDFVLE